MNQLETLTKVGVLPPRVLLSIRLLCQLASFALILFALVRVTGWMFLPESPEGFFSSIKTITPQTAIWFMLAGCSLWTMQKERKHTFGRRMARVCVWVLISSATFLVVQDVFNTQSPSLDRPAFLTAFTFILFGTALLLLDAQTKSEVHPSEILAGIGALISLLALLGYACGVPSFYRWSSVFDGRGMALHTAVLFSVLGMGVFFARPDRGLMRILTSQTTSGTMARRLILTPILIPLATGLLKTFGLRTGIYDPEVASWLFAFLNILLFTGAVVWSAGLLYRAEESLHKTNAELERRVLERTAELSAAEAKFRRLVEQSLVGIYVIQSGRFAYVNPKMAATFGYSQEEMTSRPLLDFIFEADHTLVKENVRKRIDGSTESIRYQLRGLRKDGAVIELEVHGGRSEYNGEPAVLGTLLDITERKQAETALKESEERYRLLVENSTELVCEVTLDGQFLYVSPSYKTLLGYESSDLLRTSVFTHVHPDDLSLVAPKFSQMDATGCYRYRDKGGSWRWMESSGRRFTTSAGEQRAVIISRDITERRKLEEQLNQSQKMEAIGTLAGGIAHDFNNILTALIGNAELLEYDIAPSQPGHESLMEIQKAATRAKDLVRRILTFSRKQEQQRVVMTLQAVVCEVASLLRASLPSTIEIEKCVDENCQTVLADATQIHQVVMNLATNAAYAMTEGGGQLRIALTSFEADSEFARAHPPLREGSYVRLEVTDTGCGMSTETLKRMFEPFFTTKPVGEGTGLGLSAVHGIIQNHDGLVTVYSEQGKGTTFYLFFPVVSAIADDLASNANSYSRGTGERILFVDDEAVIVNLGRAMLRKSGYAPAVFHSAEEALDAFRSNPNEFDAVITDLTMPGMTGLMLAKELRRVRSDIPVVLATGYSGSGDAKRAREAGICHVLAKPFSLQTLTKALQLALTSEHGNKPKQ